MTWRERLAVWLGAALLMLASPAVTHANGIHVGAVHIDLPPEVAWAVGAFATLVLLMFVGGWVRYNMERRRGAGAQGNLGHRRERRKER